MPAPDCSSSTNQSVKIDLLLPFNPILVHFPMSPFVLYFFGVFHCHTYKMQINESQLPIFCTHVHSLTCCTFWCCIRQTKVKFVFDVRIKASFPHTFFSQLSSESLSIYKVRFNYRYHRLRGKTGKNGTIEIILNFAICDKLSARPYQNYIPFSGS